MFKNIYFQEDNLLGVRTILDSERIPYENLPKIKKNLIIINENKKERLDNFILINPKVIDNKIKKNFGFKEIKEIITNNSIKLKLLDNQETKDILFSLKKFNFSDTIDIPLKEIFYIKGGEYDIIANFKIKDEEFPAIIKKDNKICFLFDFDKTFIDLISQTYFKKEETSLMPSFAEKLYKKLPYGIRILIYRSYFKKLHKKLNKQERFKTRFPIDPSGYVLFELFKSLLKNQAPLISIDKWPNKHKVAIALTHDTEPSSYAYERGLDNVIKVLKEFNRKSMFTLIGAYVKLISENTLRDLKDYEIGSHGLTHNLNFLSTNEESRNKELELSKKIIESNLNKKVLGIRAPGFQVSNDYFELLKKNGYKYDLSFLDVQREIPYCGSGNSFYLPFYPFINNKKSEILEIATIAPDCISPYYFGYSMKETIDLFKLKLEWLNIIGGVGLFLVHTPVWGDKDTKLRIFLLRNLLKLTSKDIYWNTTPDELYRWWKARENLNIVIKKNKLFLINKNNFPIENINIKIEYKNKVKDIPIKKIKGKEKIIIK